MSSHHCRHHHGEVLIPPNKDEVRQAAHELRVAGIEAIADCFLFFYIGLSHEEWAVAIIREAFPGAFATSSAAVSLQFRKFECSTTAALRT